MNKQSGFSLIEIVLVVMILAIVAGAIVVPLVGGADGILGFRVDGKEKSAEQVTTETTMHVIRDAIMGTATQPGAWPDLLQGPAFFPRAPSDLLSDASPFGACSFDPVTGTGWRGPYIIGKSQLIDAWGTPFVIQVDFNGDDLLTPDEVRFARLVSAGPNKQFDTTIDDGFIPGDNDPAEEISLDECGDDIVLFFRTADIRSEE
ncbi:MAG: type II secretion system protein [Planctomycetota bacterium]